MGKIPLPVSGFSNQQITNAICENLFALNRSLGAVPNGASCDAPDLQWAFTGGPALNRIFAARLQPDEVEARVAQMQEMARSRQTSVTWLLDPAGTPADLSDYLEKSGWNKLASWAGMALRAETVLPEVAYPDGLTISRVTERDSLHTWSDIINAQYLSTNRSACDAFTDIFYALDYGEHQPWAHFIASEQGMPVAASTLFFANNVAGIYWVATIPGARHHGIGTAMTHYTVQQARRLGYPLVILQATELGAPIYRRLGFTEYCTIQPYLYRP